MYPTIPSAPLDKPSPFDSVVNLSSNTAVDEHSASLQKKMDLSKKKKVMNYRQLEEVRKEMMNTFIDELSAAGIDVSSPESFQAFLDQLETVNPDLAEIILWAMEKLQPDEHEDRFMSEIANPQIQGDFGTMIPGEEGAVEEGVVDESGPTVPAAPEEGEAAGPEEELIDAQQGETVPPMVE